MHMPRQPAMHFLPSAEIADAAFDPENYRQIMGVLARRLQEKVGRKGGGVAAAAHSAKYWLEAQSS